MSGCFPRRHDARTEISHRVGFRKGTIVRGVSRHVVSSVIKKVATGTRGDVPGWVLITLMTAGLVVALWALAGPALGHVFSQAVTRVVSF